MEGEGNNNNNNNNNNKIAKVIWTEHINVTKGPFYITNTVCHFLLLFCYAHGQLAEWA
jgi:hypothetical protein